MKRIINSTVCIILVALMLVSCVSINVPADTDATIGIDADNTIADNTIVEMTDVTDAVTFDMNGLDIEMTHKPTKEDYKKIEKEMTFNEVCSVLGRPHDEHLTIDFCDIYYWYTVDNEKITICFSSDYGCFIHKIETIDN